MNCPFELANNFQLTKNNLECFISNIFLKKWANPGLFFIYFRLFKEHYKFYNK